LIVFTWLLTFNAIQFFLEPPNFDIGKILQTHHSLKNKKIKK